jgi:hypothetical protein
MGYIPETYRLFRAAKYIGVSPWELSEQSVFWMNHALEYENIENKAERKRQERSQKAARRKRG